MAAPCDSFLNPGICEPWTGQNIDLGLLGVNTIGDAEALLGAGRGVISTMDANGCNNFWVWLIFIILFFLFFHPSFLLCNK